MVVDYRIGVTYPAVRPGIVIAIFAALTIGSSLVDAATAALSDNTLPLGLTIARNGFVWMLFAVLSFLAISVARRFPLEPGLLLRNVPAHLGAFLAISVTHTVLYTTFARFVLWPGQDDRVGALSQAVIWNLRGDIFIYGMMVGAYYLYALAVRRREPTPIATADADVTPATESLAVLKRIPIKENGIVAFIDTAEVESIEADGDYVKLNGKFGSRTLRQSLSTLEKQLDPDEFARIHRSTIVSLSRIKELQPWFHGEFVAVMTSGAKLKVSRTHRAALTEALRL